MFFSKKSNACSILGIKLIKRKIFYDLEDTVGIEHYAKTILEMILFLYIDFDERKNTTSCGFTRLKFTLRNSFYPVNRHQKRSFLHILFANFCILPAFYILFYGNASNFYYRNYFLCLKLCQNYALWKISVGVIRLCKYFKIF